jgi:predicted MFS family arabinose efflux permease
VTIEFPDKREEYMGYCESAVGVGLMIGPVLGSLVYGWVQYSGTFYVFGSVIFVGLVTVSLLLPSRLNHAQGFQPREAGEAKKTLNDSHEDNRPVTFSMILTNRRAMVAAVASCFAMIFMLFFDSILSQRLKAAYDIGEAQAGYIFALGAFCFAFGSPFVGLLCKVIQRKYVT